MLYYRDAPISNSNHDCRYLYVWSRWLALIFVYLKITKNELGHAVGTIWAQVLFMKKIPNMAKGHYKRRKLVSLVDSNCLPMPLKGSILACRNITQK